MTQWNAINNVWSPGSKCSTVSNLTHGQTTVFNVIKLLSQISGHFEQLTIWLANPPRISSGSSWLIHVTKSKSIHGHAIIWALSFCRTHTVTRLGYHVIHLSHLLTGRDRAWGWGCGDQRCRKCHFHCFGPLHYFDKLGPIYLSRPPVIT